jgi:S-DNA-T family DNA segregation ATPase FtsK/SpoIIIE
MASASGSNASRSRTSTTRSKSSNTSSSTARRQPKKSTRKNTRNSVDIAVKNEVMLIIIFAVSIFAFLCVVGLIKGTAATGLSNVLYLWDLLLEFLIRGIQ